MTILDGKALANDIEKDIKKEIHELATENISVGLAVVLIGDDPASHVYVAKKEKSCEQSGIYSVVHKMPKDISEAKVIKTIEMMNDNPNINGILVQLPLPTHINKDKVLEAVSPIKDVDGFHPYNVGKLNSGLECFVPCTPLGVMKLLAHYDINLRGLDVCVVGASNIVGKPLASLLLQEGATPTLCHIDTKDLASHTKKADLIAVGVGYPGLISKDMVKEGAIIIDIGINRLESGKLVGDVDYEKVAPISSYITPVPGSVGPMTIAMLLLNTLKATKLQNTKQL
ncbi:MAG: Methylenetetrahydrofolate dehydrogenase (NADP+) (EC / Methenyltetrahydrofolate cyclohydrolase (EC [uncultured Campylobacterales bacterium]|uniref:Bifunctional protein FolD n=1 Tax=uncultured Campylobacterales bacterium TaxID=352960 RepID=A0A6S6T209_9BACT|nr:MAG: Methylenetetrahydrofolate dehydrogenase (NADP+) (EC / Methenyltetrahydrofolate cyclohydrolase (EC [uncultured Campylobacterales bacterium]